MPERDVLLDTSFLRRFTMSGQTHLLEAYSESVVTRRVVGEHATVVPTAQHGALMDAIRDIPLIERTWFDLVSAARIQLEHQNLSDTDASLVAAAQKTGYTLITADDGIYHACLSLGIPVKSFVHALLDMADAGWFTSATLKQFIDEVQRKTQYTFSADAQRILQAWKPRNP